MSSPAKAQSFWTQPTIPAARVSAVARARIWLIGQNGKAELLSLRNVSAREPLQGQLPPPKKHLSIMPKCPENETVYQKSSSTFPERFRGLI